MRRFLTLVVGIFVGSGWRTAGCSLPPSSTPQPHNAAFHYSRGTALARLGERQSAADAYQLALLLDPPPDIARLVREGLSQLRVPARPGRASETHVPVESSRGVWITMVTINGTHEGRFLVDTGSSVTIVSPASAAVLALPLRSEGDAIELQTLAGKTAAPP